MLDSAVERVIYVAELVRLICAFCDKKTLSRLARVSQTFLEPALDFLWEDAGLLQAFKCLPQALWQVKTRKGDYGFESHVLTLKHWVGVDDWSRVMYYTKRVRMLGHGLWSSPKEELSLDTYQILLSVLEDEVLFPNLAQFSFIYDPKRSLISHIPLFLSPQTTTLSFNLSRCRQSELQTFLRRLHIQCPFLRELNIYGIDDLNLDTNNALFESLLQWSHLESLTIPSLSFQEMQHLSSLPSLKTLDIAVLEETQIVETWIQNSFPALNRLSLCAPVSCCRKFIPATKDSPLSDLNLFLEGLYSQSEWNELLSDVAKFGSKHITSLHIADSASESGGDSRPPFLISNLSPLFCMTEISSLIFHLEAYFDLCADDLDEISRAWPGLHEFELVDTEDDPPERTLPKPRTTLYNLGSFAASCPNLSCVAFRFDATVLEGSDPWNFDKRLPDGKENRSLSRLYTVDCPISSPIAVACYLSSLFPQLTALDNMQSIPEWDQVAEMLPFFLAAQRQAQKRTLASKGESSEDIEI